jgi:hypothetical protein
MAASELSVGHYDQIAQYMLGSVYPRNISGTFVQEMSVNHKVDKPSLFLFTAYSAIPLTDSVRGFYDTLGEARPRMGYIRADSRTSRDNKPELAIAQQERLTIEKARLASQVHPAESICIVDEHIATRQTVRFATKILSELGVEHVSSIEGRWYHDANPDDIDLINLTSTHAEFMYDIGHLAARSVY